MISRRITLYLEESYKYGVGNSDGGGNGDDNEDGVDHDASE